MIRLVIRLLRLNTFKTLAVRPIQSLGVRIMAEENNEQKPKKSGKMLGLVFAVVNIAFMAGALFVVYSSTLGNQVHAVHNEQLEKQMEEFYETYEQGPVMYKMETFNANLYGLPQRMIRMDVTLEMLDAQGFEEVILKKAKTRDSMIRVMNSMRFDQIESVQGKLKLKNEIIASLNSVLENGVVKNVYFSDFVVQ